MRLDQALARIQQTGQTVMRTADVMGLLDVNKDHASQILSRLAGSGHLLRLKRGTWLIARTRDPLPLVGYLTAPLPSYISLQTALYHHGMISQMPTVIYCVSLARTRVYATPVGTFSVHHISAPFFCAYEQHGVKGVQMATPEKALLDFLYLSSTKRSPPRRPRCAPSAPVSCIALALQRGGVVVTDDRAAHRCCA